MSEPKKPSYSKELRAIVTADRPNLCTIDVPGMTFQGPITDQRRTQLIEIVTEIMTSRKKKRL